MQYTHKCSWMSSPEPVSSDGTGRSITMSKEFRRKIMLAVGDEPSFRCPHCTLRFKMIYATFGRLPKSFSESQFFCKDCALELGVIRRD